MCITNLYGGHYQDKFGPCMKLLLNNLIALLQKKITLKESNSVWGPCNKIMNINLLINN